MFQQIAFFKVGELSLEVNISFVVSEVAWDQKILV